MEKQKNSKRKRIVQMFYIIMILAIMIHITAPSEIKAASATVYFESEEQTITVGNEIVVNLCVESDATLGDFEGFVSYSSDKLEFTGGSSSITGSDGVLKIYNMGTTSVNTRKYVMKFKVISNGAVEFQMMGTPVVYEAESISPMSVSCMNFTLTAVAPQTASDNASLEALKINPGTLVPEFDKNVTEYQTTVAEETEKLVISAIPSDMASKVNIDGNEGFVVGENNVRIQVTAENGNIQNYIILVKKEEAASEEEEDGEDTKDVQFRFGATKENGALVINGCYYYTVVSGEAKVTIPEGYIKTSFLLDGYTIPAYQPSSGEDGDYLLLVLMNEAGDTGLYRYDRMEKTIQRFHNDQIVITKVENTDDNVNELKRMVREYQEDLNQMGLVVAVLCGLCGILLIGLIRFYMKAKGMREDDLD